jgi:cytochrome c peroxidase
VSRFFILFSVLLAACGDSTDPTFVALSQLANPPDPSGDTSNQYVGNSAAQALGHKWYFDTDFSGPSTLVDMLFNPVPVANARAALGMRTGVACVTCHDPTRAGSDQTTDPPGNRVSIGGGAYDVNSQQVLNSAYNTIIYWNGRNDSLWSQILAVEESPVSMAGSRMRVAWRIADAYRAEYDALFPDQRFPFPPEMDSVLAQKGRINTDGTCVDPCPNTYCHMVTPVGGPAVCIPRFPVDGRPGYVKTFGDLPVCTFGVPDPVNDPTGLLQPNNDAYDCMDVPDQLAITQIYVNWAKAIAAYEYTLLSRNSAFDQWITAGGPSDSSIISASAQAGAKLFLGKGGCTQCHSGPLLTDGKFHNIGVPQDGMFVPLPSQCPANGYCDCVSDDTHSPMNCLPNGAREGLRKLAVNGFRRDSRWSDDTVCQAHSSDHFNALYDASNPTECDGRIVFYAASLTTDLIGTWRTPSLRDVALTAPYMHDGVYATLDDVVKHYNRGGTSLSGTQVGTKDSKILPLNLTPDEAADLVEFLKTLTGAPLDPALTATPSLPPSSSF